MGTYAVTGGASGIGASIRDQLRSQGHTVIVVDIQQADIVANLADRKGRIAACHALADAATEGLDGLVICAGLGSHVPDRGLVTGVNYFGAVELVDDLQQTLAANRSAVVFISSNSAPMPTEARFVDALLDADEETARVLAEDMDAQQVYSGTKQAVTRWMRRNTSAYAAQGIRLNAVAPGYTRTPLSAAVEDDPNYGEAIRQFIQTIPVGRPGQPEDIANAVCFLLSEQASFICGSVLFIDGGHDAMLRPDEF